MTPEARFGGSGRNPEIWTIDQQGGQPRSYGTGSMLTSRHRYPPATPLHRSVVKPIHRFGYRAGVEIRAEVVRLDIEA
jgi:hypothetical protein